jgi:hypothetical protein
LVLSVLIFPLIVSIFSGPARSRFSNISIFSDQDQLKKTLALRQDDSSPLSRFFNNKYLTSVSIFANNYLTSFGTNFLFVYGDPSPRHHPQFSGQLLLASIAFFVVGAFSLVRQKHWFWLAWVLVAPIPSCLTQGGGYHATRLFLLVPPLCFVLGIGMASMRKKIMVPLAMLCLLQLLGFTYYYYYQYSRQSWLWWHVGYKEIFTSLDIYSPSFSKIFINNTYEPSLGRFLFWTNYSPSQFHVDFTIDQETKNVYPDYNGFSLEDRFYFGQFSESARKEGIFSKMRPGNLYVISQRDDVGGDWDLRVTPPENINILHTSTNPYNEPVLYLVTPK